jgi:membrane protein DedA with SNARE-associated domain
MIESLVELLQSLPLWGILVFTFGIAYIENLFPPSPSDVLLVFAGTLVGIGSVGFVELLATATAGSVSGFITAYALGRRYGDTLMDSPWIPFLDRSLMAKVETWFNRYHGLIIVANRFMAGTRAIIAFAAGITSMPLPRTVVYCAISAAAWNALLLWGGSQLGARWRDIEGLLSTYGWIITGLLVLVIVTLIIRSRRVLVGMNAGLLLLELSPVNKQREAQRVGQRVILFDGKNIAEVNLEKVIDHTSTKREILAIASYHWLGEEATTEGYNLIVDVFHTNTGFNTATTPCCCE